MRTLIPTTDNIGGIRQVSSDDLAVLQLQLAGGTLVTVFINSDMAGFSQDIVVCGTDGYLVAQGGDLKGRKIRELRDEVLYLDVEDFNSSESFSSALPRIHMKGLMRMVSFLRDRFSGVEPQTDSVYEPALFDQGLYIQSVIEAMRKSSETRQWVKVVTSQEEGSDSGETSWSSYA